MKEALKEARKSSWMTTGVLRLIGNETGSFQSVTERRSLEVIRMAADVHTLISNPKPITWVDSTGERHSYTADAKALMNSGLPVLVEIKPAGKFMDSRLRRRYEEIGADLGMTERSRFCLVEWDPWSTFARNIAKLLRYWCVDSGDVAKEAFARIGRTTAELGQLFDLVDATQRKHIYAALVHQELVTDLRKTALTKRSRVWIPSAERPPMRLDDLVTTWWA